jgi:hypothetical protein
MFDYNRHYCFFDVWFNGSRQTGQEHQGIICIHAYGACKPCRSARFLAAPQMKCGSNHGHCSTLS